MRLWHRLAGLLLAGSGLALSGCASASPALRSQPAGHFTVRDFSPDGLLKGYVILKCARVSGEKYKISAQKYPECDYVSVDVTQLVNKLPESEPDSELRNAALDLLLGVSDYNCSNYLSRAYALRSTFDVTSKFIGDLATAASAGTVSVAPGVSVGLDILNLLVGKANSDFDSQFYADKTFDALESAIAAERTKRKTDILGRRSTEKYSLMNALSDSRYYDDACSIKTGLASLGALAAKEEDLQSTNNLEVQGKEEKKRNEAAVRLRERRQITLVGPVKDPPR